jgi:hypothetical protein
MVDGDHSSNATGVECRGQEVQMTQSVVALESFGHAASLRIPPATTAGGAPSRLIASRQRMEWYPLRDVLSNGKRKSRFRATRPASADHGDLTKATHNARDLMNSGQNRYFVVR